MFDHVVRDAVGFVVFWLVVLVAGGVMSLMRVAVLTTLDSTVFTAVVVGTVVIALRAADAAITAKWPEKQRTTTPAYAAR